MMWNNHRDARVVRDIYFINRGKKEIQVSFLSLCLLLPFDSVKLGTENHLEENVPYFTKNA